MTIELLLGLAGFAFVSSITPGPNNMMLLTSGANFGFRRTIPHMLGISIGFGVMLVLIGLGLMRMFDLWPLSYRILQIASALYLIWLAYKIANSGRPDPAQGTGHPFTFLQAALFQWVNPKAWTMALTAITLYAPDRTVFAIAVVAIMFSIVNLPSVSIWTTMGQQVRVLLGNQRRLQIFNWSMAILLVLSLIPSFLAPPV